MGSEYRTFPLSKVIASRLASSLTILSSAASSSFLPNHAEIIEQAIERAGTKAGNKGFECAEGAIEMVNLIKEIEG